MKAVGWASAEHLVVVRSEAKVHARAVLFAVPDGGVLGSVALESLPGSRCKVEAASGAPVVLVAPVRWHAAPRLKEPARRLAYVLRTRPLRGDRALRPRRERRPPARARGAHGGGLARARRAPGDRVAGGSVGEGVAGRERGGGALVRVVEGARREARRGGPSGRRGGVAIDTVALRSAAGDELSHRGDLDVVDLSRGVSLYSSVGEDQPDG